MIFSGSVIESTTLPITLILSNANYQMQLVIVVDSISFQSPITQLPISGIRRRVQVGDQIDLLLLLLLLLVIGRERLVLEHLGGLALAELVLAAHAAHAGDDGLGLGHGARDQGVALEGLEACGAAHHQGYEGRMGQLVDQGRMPLVKSAVQVLVVACL